MDVTSEQIGRAIYWFGSLVAGSAAIGGATVYFTGDQIFSSVVLILATVLWVLGRSVRFIVAGE